MGSRRGGRSEGEGGEGEAGRDVSPPPMAPPLAADVHPLDPIPATSRGAPPLRGAGVGRPWVEGVKVVQGGAHTHTQGVMCHGRWGGRVSRRSREAWW